MTFCKSTVFNRQEAPTETKEYMVTEEVRHEIQMYMFEAG